MNISELIAENLALKEKVKELEQMLNTDALTGAKSVRSFIEICDRRDNPTHKLVVAFDIKDFGEYNKTYGHHNGDVILKMFAEKLATVFRKSDYIYRRGGDEFVAILNICESLKDVAEIQKRLAEERVSEIAYVGFAAGHGYVQQLVIDAFAEVEAQKRANTLAPGERNDNSTYQHLKWKSEILDVLKTLLTESSAICQP